MECVKIHRCKAQNRRNMDASSHAFNYVFKYENSFIKLFQFRNGMIYNLWNHLKFNLIILPIYTD